MLGKEKGGGEKGAPRKGRGGGASEMATSSGAG